MGPTLHPIKRVRCTYPDCMASFDTEAQMKRHKRNTELHDYCHKCDEDFEDYEALAEHKAFRPDNHQKACRVCGEELKTTSGLKKHIEITHKVDQKLSCLGCQEEFFRASLLCEHLEFGHCRTISARMFQSHIVHKHLITELLKGGPNYDRFMQKISKFDATVDDEDEGGVNLMDDDQDIKDVEYAAIKPKATNEPKGLYDNVDCTPYPPLPSQFKSNAVGVSDLASRLDGVSINEDTESIAASSTLGAQSISTLHSSTWQNGSVRSLFPTARRNPAPSEWSVEQHDREVEGQHGVNIMNSRFWDPTSTDYVAERFYDSVVQKYYCPFVCEQSYDIPGDLSKHIDNDHKIRRMQCPSCCKYFPSVTALVSHCENRTKRQCKIHEADDYGKFLDKLTGGFLSVEERIRPDHLKNPAVMITDPETGRMERYRPPVATYHQYTVSKPVDWKQPDVKKFVTIGHDLGTDARAIEGHKNY